ncbi:MAG: adenylosuccinate synthetase [Caldilineaceae bacterium]
MRQAFLTVDLGFGDAGKGSVVDFLTRAHAAHTVIRYNGGAQAGHRVVAATGQGTLQEHVFAQFGSGALAGAATHLTRYMILDPLAMLAEAAHLQQLGLTDIFQRTTIDAQALVITPFQRAVNRLRELARGQGRHGSCGMGIGETVADSLTYGKAVLLAGDLANPVILTEKLAMLQQISRAKVDAFRAQLPACEEVDLELAWLADAWREWLPGAYAEFVAAVQIVGADYLPALLQRPGTVIFEGAQGVLLDEWRGFHPYTTWSTTTLANADRLLQEAVYQGNVTRIGITRAYTTRHGAGPLVTEDTTLTHALPDAANGHGAWQGSFRVGWLDLVLLRYATAVVGRLDTLAVTCLDRLATLPALNLCAAYHNKDRKIEQIKPGAQPQDLHYQAQLTRTLAQCRPLLSAVADVDTLLAQISHTLGLPIGLTSYGPTAQDKRVT